MDYRKEIDRLYKLEYGDTVEFSARILLCGLGAVIHQNYTDTGLALIWFAGFVVCHALLLGAMRTRPTVCGPRDTVLVGVLTLVMLAAFLWLPAWMIVSDDLALRISGTAGTGAMLVFLIYRTDRMKWMVMGEIAVVAFAVGFVVFAQVPDVTDRGAQLVMAFAGVTLITYFARTILHHRRQVIEAEAASIRSVQAQKMEAIGQLAGGVAHDFNNILTAVTGNLDLYEVVDNPVERDQFIRDARLAADRAAGLVKQLLAYSRKSTLAVSDYAVPTIFDQVQTLSRRLLPSSINVTFTPPCPDMRIRVDQNQLITALINLIVNARDAMSGSGTLTVSASAQELATPTPMLDGVMLAPGRYVCLMVRDNGPGIPDEVLRRVTEPFFTTKDIGEGSGLGLSMVEGFARQSGGGMSITTSSEGTQVDLYIPCASVARAASPAPIGPTPAMIMAKAA